jgi:hypothetical protein
MAEQDPERFSMPDQPVWHTKMTNESTPISFVVFVGVTMVRNGGCGVAGGRGDGDESIASCLISFRKPLWGFSLFYDKTDTTRN